MKRTDDFGKPLKKGRNGRLISYVVFTPYDSETVFADKARAMRDHVLNKKHKVPSSVHKFENWVDPQWGYLTNCLDTYGSYRSDEL